MEFSYIIPTVTGYKNILFPCNSRWRSMFESDRWLWRGTKYLTTQTKQTFHRDTWWQSSVKLQKQLFHGRIFYKCEQFPTRVIQEWVNFTVHCIPSAVCFLQELKRVIIHNIAVVCKIVTSNEMYNFVTVTFYVTLLVVTVFLLWLVTVTSYWKKVSCYR